MKNIINWTLGGFFRSIGRILSFLVIGGLLALLLMNSDLKLPHWLNFGIMTVKADTVSYNFKQYRIQYYSLSNGDTAWTSWTNFSTSTTLSSGYGLQTTAVRLGSSSDFVAGNTYRVVIDLGISPSSEKEYVRYNSSSCYGTSSTSSWSNIDISDCQYVGLNDVNNSVHRKVIFDITPQANFKGFQFNIGWTGTAQISSVNVYNSTTITTGPDITGAIDEQTIIIQDGFEDISDKITEANENLIEAITENNFVCEYYDKNAIKIDNRYLNSSGSEEISSNYGITDFIKIDEKTKLQILETQDSSGANYCFYTINKVKINCYRLNTLTQGIISIPTSASYFRCSILKTTNKPTFNVCKPQGQAINDILTDTDTSSDSNTLSDFFHNFNLSIEGPISSIVLIPIEMIRSLIIDYNDDSTHADLCTTFIGQEICLPSGDIIWKRTGCHDNNPFGCPNYSAFRQFFQLVAGGLIYWKILKRLVMTAEKGLDPQESGVNLMKL